MLSDMYKTLIENFGSPLYVYDEEKIIEQCDAINVFRGAIADSTHREVSMHYSTKSNSNPAILKLIRKNGLKVDCMSPYELEIDELSGFSNTEMLYVCNNISAEEMKFVHDNGVLICLDSISQLEQWGELYPGSNVMIRINPGVEGVGHSKAVVTSGSETKFGVSEENIPTLLGIANKYGIKIIGVHQHLGSLFLDNKINDYCFGVSIGLEIIRKYFKNVKIIDLGGGFGVPYSSEEKVLDFGKVKNQLIPILTDFVNKYPSVKEFKFEPGRYIPCEAGTIIGTVTAVKYTNGNCWVGTDIGMNQLVRPSMYGSHHEIEVFTDDDVLVKANICGNVCESGDILGKERFINLPKVGDVVAVYNAGAYGYSMASNYTGRPRPAEVMIASNGETKLIRRRETIKDMMNTLVWD